MPSEQRPDAGQRLLGMLSAGARPFPYRGGVYRLLGIAPRAGARMATPPPLPPVALQYQSNAWPQPSSSPLGTTPGAPTAPPRPPATLGTARPVVASDHAATAPPGSAAGAGAESTSSVSASPPPPTTKAIELPGRTDPRGAVRSSGTASTPEIRRVTPAERIPSAGRIAIRTGDPAPAPSGGASAPGLAPDAATTPERIRVSGSVPSSRVPEARRSELSRERAGTAVLQRAVEVAEGRQSGLHASPPSAAGRTVPGSGAPRTAPSAPRPSEGRGDPVAPSTTPAPRATAGAPVGTEPHGSLEPADRASPRMPSRASDRMTGDAAGAQGNPQAPDAPAPVRTTGLTVPGLTARPATSSVARRSIGAPLDADVPCAARSAGFEARQTPARPSSAARPAPDGASQARSAVAPGTRYGNAARTLDTPTASSPSAGPDGGLLRALAPSRPRAAEETPRLRSNARALEPMEALRGTSARRAERPAPATTEPARTEPPREAPRPAGTPAPEAPRILVVRPEPEPVRATSRSFWSASTLRSVHFRVLR